MESKEYTKEELATIETAMAFYDEGVEYYNIIRVLVRRLNISVEEATSIYKRYHEMPHIDRGPHCKIVEDYANERSLDAMIAALLKLDVSKEYMIDYIKEKLPFSEEKINKRIDELLDSSKSN